MTFGQNMMIGIGMWQIFPRRPIRKIMIWMRRIFPRRPIRKITSTYLTEHMNPDVSNLCIEYMFLPAGKSCAETCGVANLFCAQIFYGVCHDDKCPDMPESCFICSTNIHEWNPHCLIDHELPTLYYINSRIDSIKYMKSTRNIIFLFIVLLPCMIIASVIIIITDAVNRNNKLFHFGVICAIACLTQIIF